MLKRNIISSAILTEHCTHQNQTYLLLKEHMEISGNVFAAASAEKQKQAEICHAHYMKTAGAIRFITTKFYPTRVSDSCLVY